jgi:hypothetical protein
VLISQHSRRKTLVRARPCNRETSIKWALLAHSANGLHACAPNKLIDLPANFQVYHRNLIATSEQQA